MKWSSVRHLRELLHPYRYEFVLGVLLCLAPAGFQVFGPIFVGRIIDEGLIRKDLEAFHRYCFWFLGIQAGAFLFSFASRYLLARFGLRVVRVYRTDLFARVLQYPIHFFDRMTAGKLATRLTNDVNSLQELFSSALLVIIGHSFLVVAVLVGMFLLSPPLAILASLILGLTICLCVIFHRRIRGRFGVMRKALSGMNSFVGESLSGQRDLRGLGAQDRAEKLFEFQSDRFRRRNYQAVLEYATFNPSLIFLTSLLSVLVMLLGGYLILNGQMTLGEVTSFLGYVSFFVWPVQEVSEKFALLQQALAAIDRLSEIAAEKTEDADAGLPIPHFENIQFRDVGFSYPDSTRPALKNLNFNFRRGEKIAVIGETGSGKTTICHLLMRFYEPSTGQIQLDGESIQNFSKHSTRAAFSLVSQDVILFSTTLRENLRFFDMRITDEDILKALELVQLRSWVATLPDGLSTMISEKGGSLSSGQRQLISVARALLRRPQLLILDEATAFVDSETERQFQESLEKLWGQDWLRHSSTLIVAHRLSTLRRADRILVMKDGEIVESGQIKDIISKNSYGAALYAKHFRSQELNSLDLPRDARN